MNYIDSALPIHAICDRGKVGEWARVVFGEIQKGELLACTSFLTFDEVFYKVRKMAGEAAALESGEALLMTPNLRFIPVDDKVVWRALEMMKAQPLLPRDAIHAGTALLSDAQTVYSEDRDFDRIKGLRRIWYGMQP